MNSNISQSILVSIDSYLERNLSGEGLSHSISINAPALEGLTTEQKDSLGYFRDYFEMEGEDFYNSNKYTDEEISDLKKLLSSIAKC